MTSLRILGTALEEMKDGQFSALGQGLALWGRGCPTLCIFPNASGPAGKMEVSMLLIYL